MATCQAWPSPPSRQWLAWSCFSDCQALLPSFAAPRPQGEVLCPLSSPRLGGSQNEGEAVGPKRLPCPGLSVRPSHTAGSELVAVQERLLGLPCHMEGESPVFPLPGSGMGCSWPMTAVPP